MLSGCTYPFDDYLPQSSAVTSNDGGADVRDAAPDTAVADTRGQDTRTEDTLREDTHVEDTFVPDTFTADTRVEDTFVPDTFVADTRIPDTKPSCVCVKWAGPMCKEWSPAGCGD